MNLRNGEGETSFSVFLPMMFVGLLLVRMVFCVDTGWMLKNGEYVLAQGIPHTEPLSMHEGMHFVMQQWLFCVLFEVLYQGFGAGGIFFYVFFSGFLLLLLLYRLLRLEAGESRLVPFLLVLVAGCYIGKYFLPGRPQLLSMMVFLLEVFLLERQTQAGTPGRRKAMLLLFPFFSVFLVNFHAAMWPIFFVLMLPYLFEAVFGHRLSRFFPAPGRLSVRELLCLAALSFLAGFLNPYGWEAMTYSLPVYGAEDLQWYSQEMKALSLGNSASIFSFLVLSLLLLAARLRRVPVRLLLLGFGTAFMAFDAARNFLLYLLVGLLPLAYAYREVSVSSFSVDRQKLFKLSTMASLSIFVIFSVSFVASRGDMMQGLSDPSMDKVFATIAQDSGSRGKPHPKVYAHLQLGSYAILRGMRPYMDTRGEIYMKSMNGQKDYLHEDRLMLQGFLPWQEFLASYDFDYVITSLSDCPILYGELPGADSYVMIYEDPELRMRVFRRD